jgi:CO/xanthine dehydrogenase FAD-binding subunit
MKSNVSLSRSDGPEMALPSSVGNMEDLLRHVGEKEIHVPPVTRGTGGAYIKLSPRSRMDLAVVGVAAVVREEKGVFADARIGLGAVAPTPMRSTKAEERLKGEAISEKVILEAAKLAAQESKPIDDHRASATYRRMMVQVLVKRAIQRALSIEQ